MILDDKTLITQVEEINRVTGLGRGNAIAILLLAPAVALRTVKVAYPPEKNIELWGQIIGSLASMRRQLPGVIDRVKEEVVPKK